MTPIKVTLAGIRGFSTIPFVQKSTHGGYYIEMSLKQAEELKSVHEKVEYVEKCTAGLPIAYVEDASSQVRLLNHLRSLNNL